MDKHKHFILRKVIVGPLNIIHTKKKHIEKAETKSQALNKRQEIT